MINPFNSNIETELAKQGLKLTPTGRAMLEIFVYCGPEVFLPSHFIERTK